MSDLCHVCNRSVATDDQWANVLGGERDDLCWGGTQCATAAVNWRTRALAAKVESERFAREIDNARALEARAVTRASRLAVELQVTQRDIATLRAEMIALIAQRDEARNIIEGSLTPPTDAEIAELAAAGGAWLVTLPARRNVRIAAETRYTSDPKEISRLWWSEGARWVAVLNGRPCARPKVSDEDR